LKLFASKAADSLSLWTFLIAGGVVGDQSLLPDKFLVFVQVRESIGKLALLN
jgi:hypothetical protein